MGADFKLICHPERSEPVSEGNRIAESKDPLLAYAKIGPKGVCTTRAGAEVLSGPLPILSCMGSFDSALRIATRLSTLRSG